MHLRYQALIGGIVCCLVVFGCELLFAQAPLPAPAPSLPAPSGGGGVIVRSLWTEIALTVVMVGLALFAVCRSSNRN